MPYNYMSFKHLSIKIKLFISVYLTYINILEIYINMVKLHERFWLNQRNFCPKFLYGDFYNILILAY
jgi:hypothetical protein